MLVPVVAVIMVTAGLVLYNLIPVKPHLPPVVDKVTIPVQPLKMKVVAVIIDDVGHSKPAARPFIEMDHPVALSILPGRTFSWNLAAEAAQRGKTILLHLPMEPEGYPGIDPGPGAILLSQSREEMREVLERDLASIPGVVGINNHMGSRVPSGHPPQEHRLLPFVRSCPPTDRASEVRSYGCSAESNSTDRRRK